MVLELSESNFDDIINQDKTVLVDFWAPWCGPCKMLGPLIENLSQQVDEDVVVCKINVDDNQAIAQKYGVASLPTILVFKSGEVTNQNIGFAPMPKLMELVS